MPFPLLTTLFASLLRAFALVALCLSVAHAADEQPNLFQSLGKLLNPTLTATVPDAPNRGVTVTIPGQGRRIALVIGNGDYKYSDSLPKLANPSHDAEDIAAALRGFGFEVIERKNQTLEGMGQAVAEFGSKIGGSEAALFYFAGHGIQVKNQNYLMPVSAKIESEAAVPFQGFNVNQILEEMDNGKSSANIVMLDACRNNPISGKFRSGSSRGLASPGNAPQGTVIVYATDPGNVAADGDGRNGLFTAGLLTAFKGGDLSLDGVLTAASEYVEQKSLQSDPTRKQTPYVNGPKTLQKHFLFRVTVDPGKGEIEKTFWTSVEHSTDPADFEAYLRKYPKGSYRTLAENQIKRLKTSQQAAPTPVAAPAKPTAARPAPAAAEDPETQFWNEVKTSGAREYLDAYLKQYPKGKYLALAKVELKKLDDQDKAQRARAEAEKQQAAENERQEMQRAEQAAWDEAKTGASLAAYANYLEHYSKGRYAALAQAAQQKLQREAADQEKQEAARLQREKAESAIREEADLWRQAENASSSVTLQTYLDRYPSSRHAAAAREKLVALRKTEAAGSAIEMIRIPGRNYEMGKTEVTQGQWKSVMASNLSQFLNCGDACPVEKVNWNDTQEFISKLNSKTGKEYRLPTEAEWEYACYGGRSTEYCGGNDLNAVAWFEGNSNGQTHPVSQKLANGYGLVDMTGNVWEWTSDCYDTNCEQRVLRGGSRDADIRGARASNREGDIARYRRSNHGFRLVRTL